MKTLNIPLEEKEFKKLEKIKGDRTWKEFLFSKEKEDSKK